MRLLTPHRLTLGFIILLSGVFLSLFTPSPAQGATLAGPADYITSDDLSKTNVSHNVSFVIPLNGHDVVATDYIRIILTNFSAVTAPTSGSGWSGVPTYGVSGNIAYVTGVTASAGDGIGISGITATNPAGASDFDVTIQVTNDLAGSIVYDSATFDAQVTQGISVASVTVSTETSTLELNGFTSPSAFVTIKLNGAVAGTTVANGSGTFTKKFTGLTENTTYNVAIFAVDTENRTTQTVTFSVFTLPHTDHILNNIVIPTTLALGASKITIGDILPVLGRAAPLSQVTVFVGTGTTYFDVVTANTQGWWTYNFNSGLNPLPEGTHVVYGQEVVIGGFTSIFTEGRTFKLTHCKIADLNCDGYVNLTDFSILMFYWMQTNPSNARADINEDGIVNLTDFSIMLYYWTG